MIFDLNLDKIYTDFVLAKCSWLRYIHPNIITLMGLVTDLLILSFIIHGYLIPIGLGFFIRYSCDCLDGAVARKYNKVSDIGGLLDTIADSTLIFILVLGVCKLLGIDHYYLIPSLIVILNTTYLILNQAVVHHHNIKVRGNLFHNIYRFGVNNNVLIYILFYIIYCFLIG